MIEKATSVTSIDKPIDEKKQSKFIKKLKKQKYLLLLLTPCLLYYIIFRYVPMYGIIIGFKRYDFSKGILGSQWVGLKYFKQFITGPFFWRLLRNTLLLSIYSLIWSFPAPIIFALLLNEINNKLFKKTVQTVSYLPHFISTVIVVGMLKTILSPNSGIINILIQQLGAEPINFFMEKRWFRTLYVSSGVWQGFGWGSIIYLASMSSINPELYEAAKIDGCGRFRCMWHITIPGILPTIIVLLILRLGQLLNVGFEKVLLMYNPGIYETADIISTYVYRYGIEKANYSFGTAVGLMNSVVALILIIVANYISRKVSETSLW